MKGVDKMDQFISTYKTHIRQRKWWWSIFVYFLDVSVVNAWLLSRKFGYNMPLLDFKRYIAKSLLKSYGTPSSQGKIPPTVVKDVRFDGLGIILEVSKQKSCVGTVEGKQSLYALNVK